MAPCSPRPDVTHSLAGEARRRSQLARERGALVLALAGAENGDGLLVCDDAVAALVVEGHVMGAGAGRKS